MLDPSNMALRRFNCTGANIIATEREDACSQRPIPVRSQNPVLLELSYVACSTLLPAK